MWVCISLLLTLCLLRVPIVQASRGKVMALNSLRSNLLEQLSQQLPAESTEYR